MGEERHACGGGNAIMVCASVRKRVKPCWDACLSCSCLFDRLIEQCGKLWADPSPALWADSSPARKSYPLLKPRSQIPEAWLVYKDIVQASVPRHQSHGFMLKVQNLAVGSTKTVA